MSDSTLHSSASSSSSNAGGSTSGTAAVNTKVKKENPWKSVNDMLMQNKCWFCKLEFKKGKLKNVFQIYQVLQYFEKRIDENLESEHIIYSDNLQGCLDHFVQLGGKTNINSIIESMQAIDIETWMSGLVCGETENCKLQFSYILPPNPSPAVGGSNSSDTSKSESKIVSKIREMMNNCPPGCLCDAPWSFLPGQESEKVKEEVSLVVSKVDEVGREEAVDVSNNTDAALTDINESQDNK